MISNSKILCSFAITENGMSVCRFRNIIGRGLTLSTNKNPQIYCSFQCTRGFLRLFNSLTIQERCSPIITVALLLNRVNMIAGDKNSKVLCHSEEENPALIQRLSTGITPYLNRLQYLIKDTLNDYDSFTNRLAYFGKVSLAKCIVLVKLIKDKNTPPNRITYGEVRAVLSLTNQF